MLIYAEEIFYVLICDSLYDKILNTRDFFFLKQKYPDYF